MLQNPNNVLDSRDTLKLMLRRYRLVAICPDSGAMLSQTNGHGKGGLPTYVLILPNKTPNERGGFLTSCDWDHPDGRKFVRQWSDEDAIKVANDKLQKMISKRELDTRLCRELSYLCDEVEKEHCDHDPEFCAACNALLNAREALELTATN